MNENFMGPAQGMENQLQGIVRDATASAANQRAARANKAQDMQDMAKLIDWHLSTADTLYATDKLASYEVYQGGMRLMNREVPSFEQYDSARAITNGAAEDLKNKDLGAMKFKLSMGDKLGKFRNPQDIARVSELKSQMDQLDAEQRAKAIADAQQPEHPQLARAREHTSMIDMVGGDLSRVQPDELIRLTGRADLAGQQEKLVHDRAIVEGQDAKVAMQKRMQAVFAADPAAFGKAAEITSRNLTDPETMAKIFISDMVAKGDARTEDETKRMTAKIETYMSNTPLAVAMGIKTAQRESEVTRAALEDTRDRITSLDEHAAVDGKAAASVTSLGAAVQGLGLSTTNFQQATKDMELTPQETALYQRHLNNLSGTGKVRNADGSISTLYQLSFEEDGKTYNIPTVWEGKILTPDESIKRARQEGLEQFPSYGSEKEAEARYQKMHGYMEKDTSSYIGQHPVDDKTGKQLLLAEGTRAVQGETYKIESEPRIAELEQKAKAADAQLNQLKAQTVTALPGQRDALIRRQKELEAESTTNRAMVRLLKDESPYAIAERKSELILNYTPQGRKDLETLEQQREKDLKLVETEQTRLRRRETILQGQQTKAQMDADNEQKLFAAEKAVDALRQQGVGTQEAVRRAYQQYGVDKKELATRVVAGLGSGLWEAQIAFGMLPTAQQTTQRAAQLAKQYGVSPVDVKKVMEEVNKPLVQLQIGQEKAEAKKVGEGFGDQYIAIQQADLKSSGQLAKLDRMEQLLTGVQTGALVPTLTQIQSIGQTFGIEVDKTLPAKQAMEALSNEIALQLRNPAGGAGMPGALSDKDREFLVSMTPGLSKTPEGNRLIIDTARKLAKRDQEVARMARTYRKQHGQFDEGFFETLASYSDTHPLFKAPDLSQYQEIRTTKDGRRLGKKADGTIEEIR